MPDRWSIGEFAKMVDLSVATLKRWDLSGRLKAGRWPSGRRYYTTAHLEALGLRVPDDKKTPPPGGR
jgi:DNA-binding transcriptional MerR regulator